MFRKSIIETIKSRKSCRNFDGNAVQQGKLDVLRRFIERAHQGPFGNTPRFHVTSPEEVEKHSINDFSTYGFVKGTKTFVIGSIPKAPYDLEDFGYVFEKLLLLALEHDLGACWLGGSFAESHFASLIKLNREESHLPAIAPIGSSLAWTRIGEFLIQTIIGSKHRKHWNEMFFVDSFSTPLSIDEAGAYAPPLEMIRLGPSASNIQPWRVVKERDRNTFHFFLKRSKGLVYTFIHDLARIGNLQRVDMGIAMCHFELSAKEVGLKGEWKVLPPPSLDLPPNVSYLVSWVGS